MRGKQQLNNKQWLLPFSPPQQATLPGLPACCSPSVQDNYAKQPKPSFNILTSISFWVIYTKLNPYSTTLSFPAESDEWRVLTPSCSEKTVWTAAGIYGSYCHTCEDTNNDKWGHLGIWDVRVPEGTQIGRAEFVRGLEWQQKGSELNPDLRREPVVPGQNSQ